MNTVTVLDVVILILFLQAIAVGYHRGLVVMAARLIALFVAYGVGQAVAQSMKSTVANQFIMPAILKKAGDGVFAQMAEPALQTTAEGIAYSILFFVLFVILEIILMRCVNLLKLVDHIPVVGKVNKIGGAIVGFIWIFLILLLVSFVVGEVIPHSILKSWGITKKALDQSVFLGSFLSL